MDDIKQRVEESKRLIDATVRRIVVLEPESPKWACDVDALKDLIQALTLREEKLVEALTAISKHECTCATQDVAKNVLKELGIKE